jgi:hypothetical protein
MPSAQHGPAASPARLSITQAQPSNPKQVTMATPLSPNPFIALCTADEPGADSQGCGRRVFDHQGVTHQAGTNRPANAKKYQLRSAGGG